MTVTERLLKYVAFDTMSDENSETCPSTEKQKRLSEALVEEMLAMGIKDAYMDEDGYVYGTVPGAAHAPVVGMIAHVDTSPACTGENVKARIVEYNGGDIALNEATVMSPKEFPRLEKQIGKHLVVTDGTTLLGADDKAGIAEILTAAEELMKEDTPHATLRIGFTPDEEIGRGADRFNLKDFGAKYAYTIDGGMVGEMEYECFNAASAVVTFQGRSVHPGTGKNGMVNSQLIAMDFNALLPVHERPESTEGYEGFAHLCEMQGDEEKTVLKYIIRDHDREKFERRKDVFRKAAAFLNERFGEERVRLTLNDSYRNMAEAIRPHYYVVEEAIKAMEQAGVTPLIVPIRGGTDGSKLSYEGLPCPNIFTGGDNFHGRFEYIPVEDMEACVRTIKNILINAAK